MSPWMPPIGSFLLRFIRRGRRWPRAGDCIASCVAVCDCDSTNSLACFESCLL